MRPMVEIVKSWTSKARLSELSHDGTSLVITQALAAIRALRNTKEIAEKDLVSAIGAIEAQKLAAIGNIANSHIGGVSRINSGRTRAYAGIITALGAGLFGYLYLDGKKDVLKYKRDYDAHPAILDLEKQIAALENDIAADEISIKTARLR